MRELILRDHLVAALRAATAPISTRDLARQLPHRQLLHRPRMLGVPLCVADHSQIRRLPHTELVECRGPHEHVLDVAATPAEITPMLEVLRRQGRCQRVGSVRFGPAMRWSWVPPCCAPDARRAEAELDEQFAAIVTDLVGWGWA